jgi:hypothetical protein
MRMGVVADGHHWLLGCRRRPLHSQGPSQLLCALAALGAPLQLSAVRAFISAYLYACEPMCPHRNGNEVS